MVHVCSTCIRCITSTYIYANTHVRMRTRIYVCEHAFSRSRRPIIFTPYNIYALYPLNSVVSTPCNIYAP